METESITIKQLFTPERRFLVPIFQRGYVLTQVGQWETFWADIVDQALIVRRDLVKPSHRTRKHFLGAIVVSADQNRLLHVSSSSVIDGQQRLTTLQLLLAALRDAISALGNANLLRQATRLVENEGEWQDVHERFKIWPTNAFQQDFQRIQTGGSAQAIAASYPQTKKWNKWVPQRPAIVDAYLFFSQAIDKFLRGSDEPGVAPASDSNTDVQRALELLEAVQTYLQIVTIELSAEDDPQVIFETLNHRGVPLEPSDLIRNFIFLYAQRHGEDPSELYAKFWRPFDETPAGGGSVAKWWREKERQGRLLRERLDLFAFHYVTFRTNRDIKIGHLFQEFRDWWQDGDAVHTADEAPSGPSADRVASVELSRIKRAASDFSALMAPDRETRLGVFASRLKRLDTTTAYPLLLWLCEQRDETSAAEFDAILTDLESYLVRRAACGLTPKGYNHVFMDLLRKLRRQGSPTSAALRAELDSLQGETNLWPDDNKFGMALLTSPLYAVLGPVKTQMFLEALELSLQTSKSEPVKLDGFLSVEHILPQAAKVEDWPFAPEMREAEDATLSGAQLRSILTHSLGNLTLLTQPLNSSVSNGPFSAKRPVITSTSRLLLNAYFQRFADTDPWSEKQIAQRSKELTALACRVWPHPRPKA